MQTYRLSTIVISLLAMAACTKSDPNRVTEDQCKAGCERSVKWQLAKETKSKVYFVHEADEAVDRMVEESKGTVDNAKKHLANPEPWDEKSLAGLSPQQRSDAIAHHKFEQEQNKIQWEIGIQQSEAAVALTKKTYETMKKSFEGWQSKAVADATVVCMASCLKRPPSHAQCLVKTQAIEDVATCEGM